MYAAALLTFSSGNVVLRYFGWPIRRAIGSLRLGLLQRLLTLVDGAQLRSEKARTIWVALVVGTLLTCVGMAEAVRAQGLIWQVKAGAATVYLVGSLHFGTDRMYPLPPAFEEAFGEANRLAVEVDILSASPSAIARIVAEKGSYADGTTLRDHISAETWSSLGLVVGRYGLPIEHFLPQKPWLVGLTLTTLELQGRGFKQSMGIDMHFLKLARDRIDILELESLDEQMSLLSGFSAREQELLLQDTLGDLQQGGSLFEELAQAWLAGEAHTIASLLNEKLLKLDSDGTIYDRLMVKRNRAMTERIAALLVADDVSFVVVGAGHLVGDHSIVSLLAERGFTAQKLSGAGTVGVNLESTWLLRSLQVEAP